MIGTMQFLRWYSMYRRQRRRMPRLRGTAIPVSYTHLIIGFTTGNQMVLYDVIDFTPSSFQMKSGSAFASQAQTKSVKTSSNTSTDTTVPQSTDTVNSSISKSEANDALNGDIFIDAIVRDVVLGKEMCIRDRGNGAGTGRWSELEGCPQYGGRQPAHRL